MRALSLNRRTPASKTMVRVLLCPSPCAYHLSVQFARSLRLPATCNQVEEEAVHASDAHPHSPVGSSI